MKIKTLLLIALLMISMAGFAKSDDGSISGQQVPMGNQNSFTPGLRVNGYTFYAFNDKVDSRYSSTEYFYGKIKGGFQWGGGLEYMMAPVQGVELSYLRLDTKAPLYYYNNGEQFTEFDVATNYIMLGGNRYFPLGGKIEPYAGAQLGMAIFNVMNPENGNKDNATKFAWGLKAGLNIWASDRVGLKLQTGVLSAVQGVGGGFYFGTGGSGAGINTYSTFFQFYIGGGLTFDLSK